MNSENMKENNFKRYALIIGIENYTKSSGFPKATYAANDAKAMAEYAQKSGFNLVNNKALLDEAATGRAVISQLNLLLKHATPEDLILLYFAGHGHFTEYGGYLIPFDYNSGEDVNESTCISFDSIITPFKRNHSKRFVFFLDACHSGLVGPPVVSSDSPRISERIEEQIRDQMREISRGEASLPVTGRAVFTSCGPAEISYPKDEFKHGLFTYYILQFLKNTYREPYIALVDLIAKVTQNVQDDSFRNGKGVRQNPASFTNIQGDFLLPAFGIKGPQPQTRKHAVFICYAGKKNNNQGEKKHLDREVAEKICGHIEATGIPCWMAPRDIPPGERWGDIIADAVEQSKVMVLVYSAQTEKSTWVLDEVNLAMDKKIRIIPFRIDNITPQRGSIKMLWSRSQCIDAFNSPLEASLNKLKKFVKDYLADDARTNIRIPVHQPPSRSIKNSIKRKINLFIND